MHWESALTVCSISSWQWRQRNLAVIVPACQYILFGIRFTCVFWQSIQYYCVFCCYCQVTIIQTVVWMQMCLHSRFVLQANSCIFLHCFLWLSIRFIDAKNKFILVFIQLHLLMVIILYVDNTIYYLLNSFLDAYICLWMFCASRN